MYAIQEPSRAPRQQWFGTFLRSCSAEIVRENLIGRSNPMRTRAPLMSANNAERIWPCMSTTRSYFARRICLSRSKKPSVARHLWPGFENSRRAKFYWLTRAGRKQLDVEVADWNRRASAIARLLKVEG